MPGNPTRTPRWDGEGNSLKVKMLGKCTDWGCLWNSEKTSRTEDGRTQDGNSLSQPREIGVRVEQHTPGPGVWREHLEHLGVCNGTGEHFQGSG